MPILFLTVLLSGLGFGLVLPGFLFFAENLGASPALATAIIATYSLGQFIATPVWGRASDRYGRKPVLVVTMAGAVLSYLLLAYATNLWVLAVARFLNGIMAGNLAVAMEQLDRDLTGGYSLAFHPPEGAGGTTHRIEVEVEGKKLQARHRRSRGRLALQTAGPRGRYWDIGVPANPSFEPVFLVGDERLIALRVDPGLDVVRCGAPTLAGEIV